ncbi:MAG: dihydrodipicolinate synthase family protein [Planctomycetes bacterium]|nr:dihydrodipicolinate synthase family protein [Planctomycetota bacterium]
MTYSRGPILMNLSFTRRVFLQAAGLGVATRACPVLAGASNRVPLKGVVPAALTPFDADLQISRPEFRRHIEALVAVRGVTAIMVNGAAGQDAALSRDERRLLVAEAVAAGGSRTPIIAALRETKDFGLEELAHDAEIEGASAVLVMPPPEKGDAEKERAQARLNRVFEATDLPAAIYQTAYSTETLTKLVESQRVFAVKEGSGDPAAFERNMRSIRALGREVAIWSTNSRWLLADLAVGADGVLSGMGSVAADLHVALAEAVWHSDLVTARQVNDRLFPLTQVFYRPGGDPHTRMKHALKQIGRWKTDAVRPPLQPVADGECAAIDRALRESGLART